MNDFTKQELNTMADGIVLIKRQCKMNDEVRQELDMLDEKLCSMINNFCDHTPSDTHYEQFRWQLCGKCGAQYK